MEEMEMEEVGEVTHFYPKISVGVIKLKGTLRVGDRILIRGATTNFEQVVESMQIMHKNVEVAEAGQEIGLKVNERVREKDKVYKLL
jgi:putative protease